MSLALGFLIVLIASAVQGAMGFGLGMLAVPFLVFIFPPTQTMPMVLLFGLLCNGILVYRYGRDVDMRTILYLIGGAILGAPVGTYLLVGLSDAGIKLLLGIAMVVFSLALMRDIRLPLRQASFTASPIGFLSGTLSGSIAIGGPPIILYFSGLNLSKAVFKACTSLYFFLVCVMITALYTYHGLYTPFILKTSLLYATAILVGTVIGIRATRYLSDHAFRFLTLLMMTCSGLTLALSSLYAILK